MLWILLLGLCLFGLLQTFLFRKLWSRGLSVTLKFTDPYIYENETSSLQEIVVNDKWLPLPALEVRLSMSRFLVFTGEATDNSGISDQSYKRDVFSLLFRQKITRTLPFVGKKRGYYEIREADAKSYDLLFKDLGFASLPQNTALYVYPSQVDVRRLNMLCTTISGMILVQNQLFPDPFEFSGLREYLPSDPINRINWKASLRMGETMVNQFDSTTNLDLALIFDVEDSHIQKYTALVEETIRITASLAARLIRGQMPLDIFSNASLGKADSENLFRMSLPANAAHMTELNQRLARIDGYSMPCVQLLSKIDFKAQGKQLTVFISKNADSEILDTLGHLASPGNPILWIIPIYAYMEQPAIQVPFVKTIFWEVEA